MADRSLPKFAFVSHILPPATSGQSVIIQRLLSGLPANSYILISREAYPADTDNGIGRLPARYYQLESAQSQRDAHKRRLQTVRQYLDIPGHIRARANELKEIFQTEQIRVAVACTGDLYDLPATALAAKELHIPFVPYLFDDYLYQWTGLMRRIVRKIEPGLIRQAAAVIAPNEYLAEEYLRRYGIKATLIRNLCPIPELAKIPQPKERFSKTDINVVYAGSVYRAHYDAFRNLITAIEALAEYSIKLHIYTMQAAEDLANEGIASSQMVLHAPLAQEEILSVVRAANWLFLPLAFRSAIPEIIKTSAPGKLGEYLAMERPILVHAPEDSFVSWYFRQHDCGLVVSVDDATVLTEALRTSLSDVNFQEKIAHQARARAETDFADTRVRKNFMQLIQDSASNQRSAA